MLLSEWVETACATIAALEPLPDADGDARGFVLVDGLIPLEGEPQIADRAFDVELVESGGTQATFGPDVVQRAGRVDVVLRYDSHGRHRETRARIDADVSLIVDALEDPATYGAAYGGNVVQHVKYQGNAATSREAHGVVVRLPFDVLYTEEKY